MNLAKAKLLGVQAFKKGLSSATGRNPEFTRDALDTAKATGGDSTYKQLKAFANLQKAYIHGWTVAHLAKDSTPDFPSVQSLKKIIENPDAYK